MGLDGSALPADPRLNGNGGLPAAAGAAAEDTSNRLRFAMVCASNMNRSMEAHSVLQKAGFMVESYGVGGRVKLPGPSAREPNVYSFGTPYTAIYEDLNRKDAELYTRNGLLRMLQRNIAVKTAPERWQENKQVFDVVITFESRVMDAVEETLNSRPCEHMRPCLVVNLEVKDSHEEAAVAAPQALRLAQMLEAEANTSDGEWAHVLEQILDRFQLETGRRPTYALCWC